MMVMMMTRTMSVLVTTTMMMMMMFQVPEEESKVANQHRSSVDMTSHPQVVSFRRIFICNGYDDASAFQTPDFDEVRNSPSRNSVR